MREGTSSRRSEVRPISVTGNLLRVSAYDRVASTIVSLFALIGTLFALLVILWITSRVFTRPGPSKLTLVKEEIVKEEEGDPDAHDIQEPGSEVLDLAPPDTVDTLAAVTDAVSTVAGSLDAIDSLVTARGQGGADGRKRGSGVIPRWQRWEIRYVSTTLEAYAKQLTFFDIELGAIGQGADGVDVAHSAQGRWVARHQVATPEERIYFIWQGGKFLEHDRALLGQAGVNTRGRAICQFFSPELENHLAVLEKEKLGGRALKDVRRTIFQVQPTKDGFDFMVADIQWRGGSSEAPSR